MNTSIKSIILLFMVFSIGMNLQAQNHNLESVTAEIKQITEIEIEAFKRGDCDKAIDFMDDDITFYGNGRKAPSKEVIKNFCSRLTRPFEKPSSVDTKFYPLTEKSAYVVRTMEFAKNEKVYKKEIVTKVWKKGINDWKIMHLHSTIKQIAEN